MSAPESNNAPRPAEPIAIVGIGCAFPKAPDVQKFWSNVKSARDAITEIPSSHWKPEDYFDPDQSVPDMTYAKRGGFLDPIDFPPLDFGISPNNIEATDTTQLLGMMIARDALRDAGYAAIEGRDSGKPFDRQRTSVILGVTGALELVIPLGARLGHPVWRKALKDHGFDDDTTNAVVKRIAEGYVPWQENSFPGLLGNVAAGRIANRFDLGGTNCVVDAACASSLSAIHMAAMELHAGDADMVISGGLDTFNDIFMYMCFSKTPALSPTGTSRPFSADGDGTILGEGLGIVVLKRLSDADRDSDRVYAVIRGVGAASDGQGSAIYAPQSRGQAKAMRSAYARSDITPDTVELIEAHGTGTRVGDAVELESVSSVFGEHKREDAPWCALGSVKSMIGHTKAAAGAAGLIKIALALKHKVLPPTINVTAPLPGAVQADSPVYLNTESRPWIPRGNHPRRAAVSAFGFGGSNFHCVLEEHESVKQEPDWSGEVLLFALSADSRKELHDKLAGLSQQAAKASPRALSARARLQFDHRAPCRFAFVHEGAESTFAARCKKLLRLFDAAEGKAFFRTPDGAYFGQGEPAGKLCALFPGQGSQYVGMLRDWSCQFPEMVSALQAANQAHGDNAAGIRLSDRIYPVPAFDDEVRAGNESALRDTRTAQPAIGALSLGALNVLRRFGIEFDASAGHSFGELTALYAAGRIAEDDFHALATARGAIMAALDGDRGAMLAVSASVDATQALIDAEQLDLVIANRNAPEQIVLSGARTVVDRAMSVCEAKGIRARKLPVSAAFHSALVADAQRPFHDVLKQVEFRSGTCSVYSNTSAMAYPDDVNAAKALLSGQLANPVDFVEEIENLHAAGMRTFIEIGPSNKLSSLVSTILGNREHHVIATDASSGARPGEIDLASALAHVAALGYPVDLSRFDEAANPLADQDFEKQDRLTVKLTGANYMKERPKTESKPSPAPALARPASDATPKFRAAAQTPRESSAAPNMPAAPVGDDAIDVLKLTQENILALQELQQQTAELHRQYLESQETSQRAIERLMTQQARLLGLGTTGDEAGDRIPVAAPAPAERAEPAPATSNPQAPVLAADAAPVGDAAQAQPPATSSPVSDVLLAVVVEKTGYPADMLSLDMSLDADLGIDSIKRVEILSALSDALPNIAEVNPEDIGQFRTLADIVSFVESAEADVPASEAQPASPTERQVGALVVEVVSEKTGYPVDMLSMDMDLDADLGIDSIKRVEILSALQDTMDNAPEVPPDALGRFRTLTDVAAFLGSAAETSPMNTVEVSGAHGDLLIGVVAEKTGYPADMLSLEMSMDADLGIDSIKRVEILSALQDRLPGAKEIDASEIGQLRTLGDVLNRLFSNAEASPAARSAAPAANTTETAEASDLRIDRKVLAASMFDESAATAYLHLPAGSQIWITDDGAGLAKSIRSALSKPDAPSVSVVPLKSESVPSNLAGLILVSPPTAGDEFIVEAFQLMKNAADPLRAAANKGGALLAGITRVNGAFGLNGGAISNPRTAGLGGLIKCAGTEWPGVTARVIDVAESAAEPGEKIARVLRRSGPVEIGITLNETVELLLHDAPLETGSDTAPFEPGELVVVTGGARGVTATVAVRIAESCQPSLLLLGRSPQPTAEPAWLVDIDDVNDIRRALLQRGDLSGRTPADIDREIRRIQDAREIRKTLERIRSAGSAVMYRSVDVRSHSQLATACNEARRKFGPVRGIIHGAGVLADKLIEDKTPEQFELVYATKVQGFENLIRASGDDALKVISVFSSSTARFGRKGQADYAAANEVLNKRAQQEARRRSTCRVVSINWGPWDGGMVGPSLKRLFAAEGVGAIPLHAGAELHLREIAAPPQGTVEVVVLATPIDVTTPSTAATRIDSA
ncbi:MAG TPA: SDR family NAD(P)-dependent oxidoreductase [Gammaproteobacteria bacterium]